MLKKCEPSRGLIRTVVLIVVALIILGYFGFNLRTIISSPTVEDNLRYAKESTVTIWNSYLKKPATYLWNVVFYPAIDRVGEIKDASSTPQ